MLLKYLATYWVIGIIGVAILCLAFVGCILFVRARYIEYKTFQKWLQSATTQVLWGALNWSRPGEWDEVDPASLPVRLGLALYKLGSTRSQRYVLRKVLEASPYASFTWIVGILKRTSRKVKWWTLFKPAIR